MQPADVLAALLRSDPAGPRITCYDDRRGERIELSAKVLANWVNKAANLLVEEYDAGPGTRIALALPPHWRTLYWAFAAWSVGATVVIPTVGPNLTAEQDPTAGPNPNGASNPRVESHPDADVLILDAETAAGAAKTGPDVVAVTMAALARASLVPLPAGALDEAKELATFADQFVANDEPDPSDAAVIADGETAAYDEIVGDDVATGARVHTGTTDTAAFLRLALGTYAAGGSLVLSRDTDPGKLDRRLADEGVTDPR